MQPDGRRNDGPLLILTRSFLLAYLGIGLAMVWLWDTMGRQDCHSHPLVVSWKGIQVCASATQANLWKIGDVAFWAFAVLTIVSSLLLKFRRGRS